LGSLLLGCGDPLVVDPTALATGLQRAILGVMARYGNGVSAEQVQNELAGKENPDQIMQEIVSCTGTSVSFSEGGFAALVGQLHREKASSSIRRGALEVVRALDEGETPEGVAAKVAAISEHTHPPIGNEVENIGDNMHELFLSNDKDALPLGMNCLDALKVVPGNLTVLAARPGFGKTALLGTFTLAAANNGWRVLFFSLEMPGKQIRQRLLAGNSSIPMSSILHPEGTELLDSVRTLSELPIGVRDAVAGDTLTVERIAATVRAYRKRYPDDILAVMVDYIQLVKCRDKYDIRHQMLGHVCRELKATALREKVPMVVAAQIGRGVENRGKEAKPQLSDLRESGEIENTADQVVLVHRESILSDTALLAVAKYRMGAPFVAEALFDGPCCVFRDVHAGRTVVREEWQ
jgi:replicative DNA helicase